MSRARKKIDPNQMTIPFGELVERYETDRDEILDAIDRPRPSPQPKETESEFEFCVEIAAAIKRAVRSSGLSRDEVVHQINEYFGRSREGTEKDPPECRLPLTLHMFQRYLGKPHEAPIPTYYLFAICQVTDSLEPIAVLAQQFDAQLITREETRFLALGKLEANAIENRKLKKQLLGRG